MAKVSKEAKHLYSEKISEYKRNLEETTKKINQMKLILQRDDSGASYKKILIADETMKLISLYGIMNRLSLELLGIKNEFFINEARKACYESLILLEAVFGDLVNAPFADYKDNFVEFNTYPIESKYNLLKKLGFSINMVKDAFGENSKWKLSFIDLEGRHAVISHNCIDFKSIAKELDPRERELYSLHISFIEMTIKALNDAANSYRLKYELTTNKLDDFKRAILLLATLRRLYSYIGKKKEMAEVQKKIDVWKAKLQSDKQIQENRQREARK
ncbi:hypothetical protein EW093_03255 [Thiospirochaeta perfilievii]|uniref:Uncharacterized protein n=1 Tax=Thiospirochaeta perfilievii TaxID=252967 RepID=A0A5C1Q8K2_9SPIO|nr:hypothetical protein [Thiospirochaeta perfilievii]QEN03757.1 hypothetical protein EW093_03255 [Thiospirochaeta perfilievii]